MEIKLKDGAQTVHVDDDIASLFSTFQNISETTQLDCPTDLLDFIISFAERYSSMDEKTRRAYSKDELKKWGAQYEKSDKNERSSEYTWYRDNFGTFGIAQLITLANTANILGFEALHNACAFSISQHLLDPINSIPLICKELGVSEDEENWY